MEIGAFGCAAAHAAIDSTHPLAMQDLNTMRAAVSFYLLFEALLIRQYVQCCILSFYARNRRPRAHHLRTPPPLHTSPPSLKAELMEYSVRTVVFALQLWFLCSHEPMKEVHSILRRLLNWHRFCLPGPNLRRSCCRHCLDLQTQVHLLSHQRY